MHLAQQIVEEHHFVRRVLDLQTVMIKRPLASDVVHLATRVHVRFNQAHHELFGLPLQSSTRELIVIAHLGGVGNPDDQRKLYIEFAASQAKDSAEVRVLTHGACL